MTSMPKINRRFGQIFKWDDKKWHVDSWGFLGKWQIWQEVIKGLTNIFKIWQKRWQKGAGTLTNGDYNRNTKFSNNSFKVCQKIKRNDKRAMLTVGDFYKMTNLVKIANLARSNEWLAKIQMRWRKNGLLVIRDFYEDSKFAENGKFGKNTWKVWTKFKRDGKKGYLGNYWFFEKGKFLPKMVNFTKVNQMFGKNSKMSWQKESMWKFGYQLKLNLVWSLI